MLRLRPTSSDRLRRPCGVLSALSLVLLASWPAVTARSAPQKPGGGGCQGGPITVTVTADESEVLVGHDVTFTATVNGHLCEGSWNKLCPDASPSFFAYLRPPEDTTRDVCCDRIGPMEYVYAAVSGGGPTGAEDDDGATVTVVGPNEFEATGFGAASAPLLGGSEATLAISFTRDGQRVGPCVAPTVAYNVYVWQDGEYVSDGQGWANDASIFWDTSRQVLLHRITYDCGSINAANMNGSIGPAQKVFYRITYDTQCGETEGSFETEGIVIRAVRTGDCVFELDGGVYTP